MKRLTWVGLLLCLGMMQLGFLDPRTEKNNLANEKYNEKNYDEALSLYRQAQIEDPDNPEIAYNIANSMHHRGDLKGATQEYVYALAGEDAALQASVLYNLGNTLYRAGDSEAAQAAYEKALMLNPGDRDAKFNLEFIKQKMEQQEQEQKQDSSSDQEQEENEEQDQEDQQNQEQQDSGDQDQQEQQEQQKSPSGSDQEDQQESDSSGQGEQDEQNQDQQQDQQQEQEQEQQPEQNDSSQQMPSGFSREDAERILEAWEGREGSLKGQRKESLRAAPPVEIEKDW
jgi:Ca-activated chloride channel homolog